MALVYETECAEMRMRVANGARKGGECKERTERLEGWAEDWLGLWVGIYAGFLGGLGGGMGWVVE